MSTVDVGCGQESVCVDTRVCILTGMLSAAFVASAAIVVQTLPLVTVVHPFLLADNRHYTFYLWRRVFSRAYSHALGPVYVLTLATAFSGIGATVLNITTQAGLLVPRFPPVFSRLGSGALRPCDGMFAGFGCRLDLSSIAFVRVRWLMYFTVAALLAM